MAVLEGGRGKGRRREEGKRKEGDRKVRRRGEERGRQVTNKSGEDTDR